MGDHDTATDGPASTDQGTQTPERVTVTFSPAGRRAMDTLVATRGKEKSRNADDGTKLLALIHTEITTRGDGSYLAFVRPDGSTERIHVT